MSELETEEGASLSPTEEEAVYRCPEGDYESENFNSVRAHCQRKHRYRIELINGMVKKIEPSEKREEVKPTPEVPVEKKELISPKVKVETPVISVPLSPEVKSYIQDSVEELIMGELETRRAQLDQRRHSYPRQYRRPWEEPVQSEIDQRIDEALNRQTKISLLKSLKSEEGQPQSEYNAEVQSLRDEVKTLREYISKQEKATQEKRFENMEKNMEKLVKAQEELSKSQKGFYDVAGQFIPGFQRNVGVIAHAVAPIASMYGRNVAKRYSELSGEPVPSENPEEPQIERLPRSEGIIDNMSIIMVEECLRKGGDPYRDVPLECSLSEMEELIRLAKERITGKIQPKTDASITITEEA